MEVKNRLPIITETLQQLYNLDLYINEASEIAVDTETTGLERNRKVIGLSFCFNAAHYTYLPIYKWDGNALVPFWNTKDSGVVYRYVKQWLNAPKKWIGHNIVFDVISLENEFGINIIDRVYSDTALLHHTCISEDPPHGLKTLAAQFIDASAGDAQEDLELNIKAKGGIWKKDTKEFFKGDIHILGKYGALDPFYTFKLHKLWYPEIEKQNLQELWSDEVLPLTKVIYQLNTTGLKLDVPYFEALKIQVAKEIEETEVLIYAQNKEALRKYELNKIKEGLKLTTRSVIGKILLENKLASANPDKTLNLLEGSDDVLYNWYCEKNNEKTVFNLDSKDDLAHLLFKVLKLPILKETKSGSPATDKATLDALLEEVEEDIPTLGLIKKRSKDNKLLNTYVIPILENAINGRIYPQFNQIGTSSGRFTSSEPINFQTLPRDDLRIKKGFIADEGQVIINSDFASLEPKCFADVSDETELKRVYSEGLDLYSHVHKMVMNDDKVSAKEGDSNFLKKVNPAARQAAKVYTLAFAYGMSEYKYASTMKVDVEDALAVKNKYFKAFPNLLKYQAKCMHDIETDYFVQNLMGRRKRAKLLPLIHSKYSTNTRNIQSLKNLFYRIETDPDFVLIFETLKKKAKPVRNAGDFAYAVKNEYNNSLNFPIQSLAAAIANAAAIQVLRELKRNNIDGRLVLQVHDELTLLVKKEHSELAAKLLKEAMVNNKVTRKITVKMGAEPIICENLSEAK